MCEALRGSSLPGANVSEAQGRGGRAASPSKARRGGGFPAHRSEPRAPQAKAALLCNPFATAQLEEEEEAVLPDKHAKVCRPPQNAILAAANAVGAASRGGGAEPPGHAAAAPSPAANAEGASSSGSPMPGRLPESQSRPPPPSSCKRARAPGASSFLSLPSHRLGAPRAASSTPTTRPAAGSKKKPRARGASLGGPLGGQPGLATFFRPAA